MEYSIASSKTEELFRDENHKSESRDKKITDKRKREDDNSIRLPPKKKIKKNNLNFTPTQASSSDENYKNLFKKENKRNKEIQKKLCNINSVIPKIEELKKILKENPKYNINYKYSNRFGRTLLHIAVIKQRIDVVDYLVQKGADVNTKDYFGDSPLHSIIGKNNYKIKEILLKRNDININIQNKLGQTPLMLAIINGQDKNVNLLLGKMASKEQKKAELLYGIKDKIGNNNFIDYLSKLSIYNLGCNEKVTERDL
jgi:ankyrin repeat protein